MGKFLSLVLLCTVFVCGNKAVQLTAVSCAGNKIFERLGVSATAALGIPE